MIRIALTGGIASGKTTVSDLFAALEVPVVDADILAREAVAAESAGLAAVRERFGSELISSTGSLDRAALREIIFSDENARRDLEAIIHPQVRALTAQRLAALEAKDTSYALIVIPLLAESGRQHQYDQVLVVDVAEEVQLARLQKRDGSSLQQAQKIIASQASRQQRLAIADFVIDNSVLDGLDKLAVEVKKLHHHFLQIAAAAS